MIKREKNKKQRDVIIGYRIRQLRIKKGDTQNKIAEQLSVSPQHYGTLERGVNPCSLDNLIKICNIYHVSISDLIGDLIMEGKEKQTSEMEKITSMINNLSADHKDTILALLNYLTEKEKIAKTDKKTKT